MEVCRWLARRSRRSRSCSWLPAVQHAAIRRRPPAVRRQRAGLSDHSICASDERCWSPASVPASSRATPPRRLRRSVRRSRPGSRHAGQRRSRPTRPRQPVVVQRPQRQDWPTASRRARSPPRPGTRRPAARAAASVSTARAPIAATGRCACTTTRSRTSRPTRPSKRAATSPTGTIYVRAWAYLLHRCQHIMQVVNLTDTSVYGAAYMLDNGHPGINDYTPPLAFDYRTTKRCRAIAGPVCRCRRRSRARRATSSIFPSTARRSSWPSSARRCRRWPGCRSG